MEQYIKKSALVAEIKERIETYNKGYANGDDKRADALEVLLHDIANFEVKEIDLDFQTFAKEMDSIFALPSSETENTEENPLNWEYAIAKHFFELGMKVSNKQIEEKENIDSPEEKCNTVYKNITMINMDGNIVKSKIEQREKV